jgi:hypothetical protein
MPSQPALLLKNLHAFYGYFCAIMKSSTIHGAEPAPSYGLMAAATSVDLVGNVSTTSLDERSHNLGAMLKTQSSLIGPNDNILMAYHATGNHRWKLAEIVL